MKHVLPEELDEKRIYDILLNLSLAVDKIYASKGIVKLQSIDDKFEPVQIHLDQEILDAFANFLVSSNNRDGNQYRQYKTGGFHGHSINTFLYKHPKGIGHETSAYVFKNFKLFIKAMIKRWLNTYLNLTSTRYFQIDFSNTFFVENNEDRQRAIEQFVNRFNEVYKNTGQSKVLKNKITLLSDFMVSFSS